MMTPAWLLVVLVVLFWAAAHVFLAGHRSLAGTRDRILTGRTDEGVPITLEHRRLLYRTEWRPLGWALASLALSVSTALVVLPEMTVNPGPLRLACRGSALLLLGVFVARGPARAEERRMLERTMAGPERRLPGEASPG
jgi:uncharacterized membrane protein YbhN (UPF0104 family)